MATLSGNEIMQRALLDILTSITATKNPVQITESRKRKPKYPSIHWQSSEAPPLVHGESFPICIYIVERTTPQTMTICWSDARVGHCTEQTWRMGLARSASRCLLTGERIQRGDRVFRPQSERGTPFAGRDRMILACAVDRLT
jgi:hypothetical protein